MKSGDQASNPAIQDGTNDLQKTRGRDFHGLHEESKAGSDLQARVLHKDRTTLIQRRQDLYSNLDLARRVNIRPNLLAFTPSELMRFQSEKCSQAAVMLLIRLTASRRRMRSIHAGI